MSETDRDSVTLTDVQLEPIQTESIAQLRRWTETVSREEIRPNWTRLVAPLRMRIRSVSGSASRSVRQYD